MRIRIILLIIAIMSLFTVKAQVVNFAEFKPDYTVEKQFEPYVRTLHMFEKDWNAWKSENKVQYSKELWYYSKSFYVKRNNTTTGDVLDASMVDVSRFEYARKDSEESVIVMPGFRDAIVLIPANKLIYKPSK